MFLQRASVADLDAVMLLEEAGFSPGIIESRDVFRHRLEVFPEGFFLVHEGGTPWGYFCSEVWADSSSPPHDFHRFDLGHDIVDYLDRKGDTLYIASMTVHPDHRGAGRGQRFFELALGQMLRDFPGLRRAELIVNEHWVGARTIYLRQGFVETGRLEAFFRPASGPVGDAIRMEKVLIPPR